MKRVALISLFSLLVVMSGYGCGRRGAVKTVETEVTTNGPEKFKLPSLPSYLTEDQDKADFVLLNYWNNADFTNQDWSVKRDRTEEIFGNFIYYVVNNSKIDVSREAVKKMMDAAAVDSTSYATITEFVDKYLYDPNSPVRNEELYVTALESQINNPSLDEVYKIAPKARLKMAMKNRMGEKANNFSYTTSKGVKGSLYGLDADYLLVFFYNLGCPACRSVRMELLDVMKNPDIEKMFRSGRFKILALYPDTNMEEWDKYVGDIPADWINAYDKAQDINSNELYDLKAIPSLYLLDKNKNVLIKDFVDPKQLVDYIK